MDKGRQPRNFRRINRAVLLCVIEVPLVRSSAPSIHPRGGGWGRGDTFYQRKTRDRTRQLRSANDLSGGKMSRDVTPEFECRLTYACAL